MSPVRPAISAASDTAVIIPAYQPSAALVNVVSGLCREFTQIVIVDDGSGPAYANVFDEVVRMPGVRLLRHESNRGKGAALKTGISHALAEFPHIDGVITADADGQHLPEDIARVRDRFRRDCRTLVLGSRAFDRDVPLRSQVGNTFTRWAMRLLFGEKLSDTQTGLRAIPREFAAGLLHLPTTRYEFELDMLMAAREQSVAVVEEPIHTVYETGNTSSHFNPLLDSMRIYFVLLRFCYTSLLTAVIDNVAFYFAYRGGLGLFGSQVAGRAIAVLFNYIAVRSAVFCARDAHRIAMPKFLALVAVSGTAAYFGIRAVVASTNVPVLWAKIAVESLLFFVNFAVQRHWVFPKRGAAGEAVWRPVRIALWTAVLVGCGALFYGLATTNVLQLYTWTPSGTRRFRFYTIAFVIGASVFYRVAPKYFPLALSIAAVACSVMAVGIVPVGSLALIVSSCAVLGRWLFGGRSWVVSFVAGLAVWALAIGLLASVPVHYAVVYVSLLVAVIAFRWRNAADLFRALDVRCSGLIDWRTYAAFSLVAFLLIAHLFAAIKPEVSADGLSMHLAIAADFANHHAFTFDFRQFIWALMPMGADFCYALAYMLGGEYAARLLNLIMLGSIAYLIYRAAREWVSAALSLLLAGLFLSAPLVQLVTGSMLVENFVAAVSLSAGVALLAFYRAPSLRGLLLCAFLLGSASAWKLAAIAIAIVLLPAIVVSARRLPVRSIAAALFLFLVVACFPYVKAYVLSGNPVYPFGNSYFKSPYIAEDLRDHRYEEKLTWRTPMRVTFETNHYYEGQDGSFGFQYILLLPLCAFAMFLRSEPMSRVAALTGLLGAMIIIAIQPNARYLYPALPFLTLGAAAALGFMRSIDRRLLHVSTLALIAISLLNIRFLPTANWYHRDFFLRPFFAERGRVEYIRGIAPVREAVDYVNKTGGAVVFTEGSDIAGVRAPVYSNFWHNYPFRKSMEAAKDAAAVRDLFAELKVAHLIAPNTPDPYEAERVPALYAFMKACTQPEFRAERHTVLSIKPNCTPAMAAP